MIRRAFAMSALCGAAGYAVLRAQARPQPRPALPPVTSFVVPAEMRAPGPAAGPIDLVSIGPVARERLDFLCEVVREVFAARCRTGERLPIPPEAWVRDRDQVDADVMLGVLVDRFPDDASRVLAITERDMFAAGRPYVFGYGHLRDRVAIVSTARLDPGGEGMSSAVLRARMYKAVVHELGHTTGNPHCQ